MIEGDLKTMTKKYILSETSSPEESWHYDRRTYTMRKVLAALSEKLGFAAQPFYASYAEVQYVASEYKKEQNNIDMLMHFDPALPSYLVTEDEISPRMTNTIYYDKTYKVAIGYVSRYSPEGMTDSDAYMFAEHAEQVQNFRKMIFANQRTMQEKEILLFTDTAKGLLTERKRISHSIKREEIIMNEDLKREIFESIDSFFEENDNFFKKYNIPHRRGVLLHGKPGNGKTTLVKSVVDSISAPVIYWQVNEFTNSGSIEDVFKNAEELSPAVLVIEDLDSLPPSCRSTFLNKLDGATAASGIFLIGTTNYPERVDSALKNRPGRFDRIYEIELPNDDLRHKYMLSRGFIDFVTLDDIGHLVAQTKGFSFVQLNEVFISLAFSFHTTGNAEYKTVVEQTKKSNECNRKNDYTSEQGAKAGFIA